MQIYFYLKKARERGFPQPLKISLDLEAEDDLDQEEKYERETGTKWWLFF